MAGDDAHELGHSVYEKNLPRSVPYVLRVESHPLTTEGLAMMFERMADDAAWLRAMGVEVPDAESSPRKKRKLSRNKLLIFSRWCQVMLRFEMGLYDNPEQDLNRLWWDLVEKYQEVKRPEGRNLPDYATQDPHRQLAGLLPELHDGRSCSPRRCITPSPARSIRAPTRRRWFMSATRRSAVSCEIGFSGPACTMNWNELTRTRRARF